MAIITISRGTRSGGQVLANCLAERMGYPLLGREVAQDAAAKLGVPAALLEREMTARPSLWSRFSSMRKLYLAAVQTALAEQAAGGDLVYHGLAGGLLLRGAPATLRLRLIAPMADRVRAVMAESDMDAASAEHYIRDVDESRACWVRVMYGEEIMDCALYDLVINLEKLGIDGACAVVRQAVVQPAYVVTDDAAARLADFVTACRVRLALVAETELRALDIDASVNRGVVGITGEAPVLATGRMGQKIVELARAVPGVTDVRLNVEWFDPYP